MTFTEMLNQLNQTWGDQPQRVRAIAARYYIGAETIGSLKTYSQSRPVSKHLELPPVLTNNQVQHIINMR